MEIEPLTFKKPQDRAGALSRDPLQDEFRLSLQSEFSRRCRVNERYSLRGFAAHLELHSSTLSQILSGKRRVSRKLVNRIYEQIGHPGPLQNSLPQKEAATFVQTQADAFALISDWYHYAILDLVLLKGFQNSSGWIARKLGISQAEASLATRRLLRMGFLTEKNGKLTKSQPYYTNYEEGVSSQAHKEYQRQIITKALHAIEFCRPEKKDITGMTIAADSSKLPEAKLMIKKFRRELCAFLENGRADSVYHLALQLYPVTSFESEGKTK
jgi:transcriptional regulator with XRE-family HTH domain